MEHDEFTLESFTFLLDSMCAVFTGIAHYSHLVYNFQTYNIVPRKTIELTVLQTITKDGTSSS